MTTNGHSVRSCPRAKAIVGTLAAAVAITSIACTRTATPAYPVLPNWEPTSTAVPIVPNRQVARQELDRARAAWDRSTRIGGVGQRFSPDAPVYRHLLPHYTYIRAQRIAENEVDFTVLIVDQARVIRRTLLVADPRQLVFPYERTDGYRPSVAWQEREGEIGQHPSGAAPVTIDDLYDICEKQILGTHPDLHVHLAFHENGQLGHCGYLGDDCSDCPQVSIQSVRPEFVPIEYRTPLQYLCVTELGLFFPWMPAESSNGRLNYTCAAADPRGHSAAQWEPPRDWSKIMDTEG